MKNKEERTIYQVEEEKRLLEKMNILRRKRRKMKKKIKRLNNLLFDRCYQDPSVITWEEVSGDPYEDQY